MEPTAAKPRRRLRIALIVVGVVLAVASFAVYRLLASDTARKMAAVLAEAKRSAEAGVVAPGAAEVRALGCFNAAVLDMRPTFAIVGIDAGTGPVLNVVCNLRGTMEAPSCESVAETYSKAVPDSPLPFSAIVRRMETNSVICQQNYPAPSAIVQNAAHWHEVEEAEHGHEEQGRDAQ